MKSEIEIKPLPSEEFDDFFLYLNDHISDNGRDGTALFIPISQEHLSVSEELKTSFKNGQTIAVGESGWRRLFVARNKAGDILGHIDLKSHNQNYTEHRAVLGMGVHRDYRKIGLGKLLMETIFEWAKEETSIERIDLQVLSGNSPAIRLYKRLGFQQIGEVEDMFRIDGASLSYIMMTKYII